MNLTGLTIDSARSAVADRKTSALALAEAFYAKIEADDQKIGAYLILSHERGLEKASEIDRLADKGDKLPPLAGVPVGIKDVLVTKGCAPPQVRRFLATTCRLTIARRLRVSKLQAPWCSAN
jgi:aspartyl-tRNA(Asn)/glutamyl-tRNA(Gln) amidotransferase subunit A